MRIYMLFGLSPPSLEAANRQLESSLGIQAIARESMNRGDYFTYGERAGEYIQLMRNLDPEDGELLETQAKDFSHIIYLNNIAPTSPLIKMFEHLPGLTLVWRKEHS
jgi:hypothetical protein